MKKDSMYGSLESVGQTGNRLANPPPKEPDAGNLHVRVCEGPGRQRPGLLGNQRLGGMRGWCLVVYAVLALTVEATDFTWIGPANSDWFATTNWSPNGPPGAGDNVAITNGTPLLTNTTADLASFTITNATLTFTNWLTTLSATNVQIRNLGKLAHMTCSYTNIPAWSNRVSILASNVTIDAGGSIDTTGKGFTDGGPGAGVANRTGGGYGGYGAGWSAANGGRIYGSALAPTDPGSRGFSENQKPPGGGVVRIVASGHVLVNGSILADGASATMTSSGAGSGGSVYITCNTFGGTNGSVTAKGGSSSSVSSLAGGGGGRIAVYYAPAAQALLPKASVRFDANYGASASYTGMTMGTVVFPDGQLVATALTNWFGYFWPWAATNVVTVSNLTLNAVSVGFGSDQLQGLGTDLVINVKGGISLTNSSSLYLYSGLTNAPAVTNCGLLVNMDSNLDLATNCRVYVYSHPTNGASPYFRLENLSIATNAGMNANSSGYIVGYGVGRGKASRVGGGYGGRGQNYSVANGGGTYGSADVPSDSGSPGFSENAKGTGGGAVRIEARNAVTMNGFITANGQDVGNSSGAGAGGTIYIYCLAFSGNVGASLIARGGNAGGTSGAGGGGGRIAVYRAQDAFFGTANVTNGTGDATKYPELPQSGTLVWSNVVIAGTHILTVLGRPATHGASTPYNYGENTVTDGVWVTNGVNSPADSAGGVRYACIGWSLTNTAGPVDSGSSTQAVFQMNTNLWLTWNWTSAYYLATAAATNGILTANQTAWYTNGAQVSVEAVPNSGYYFLQWTGDLPTDQYYSASVTLTMDQPRSVLASFASNSVQNKTWTGSGDWFNDYTNWNPAGVPGREDMVTLAAGTAMVSYAVGLQSLTVNGSLFARSGGARASLAVSNGVTVSGTAAHLVLSNADLTCATLVLSNSADMTLYSGESLATTNPGQVVSVAQDMVICSNCWVYPTSHPTNGAAALFQVGRLRVDGPTGGFNADGRGWAYPYGLGFPSTANMLRWGGSYGGRGQGDVIDHRYGSATNPVYSGSAGSAESSANKSGSGGGLVRIAAAGNVTLNGAITARGQDVSNHMSGGSGGGIYIVCCLFSGNSNGVLNARGGNAGATAGAGGGGGRIAVWRVGDAYSGSVSVTNGSGDVTLPPLAIAGTVVWVQLPPLGAVFKFR